MVIGTALLWGNVPTMILAITLAFIFGYSFTLFAVRGRPGLQERGRASRASRRPTDQGRTRRGHRVDRGDGFADNAIIALTPGAMDEHPSGGLFRSALLGASPWPS
ncbi:hypothetical protein GCM10010393_31130 [Streptomyces gobitricini]|uniref:Uncharacterized protein n=1 Tax=Streptomyces gobitricini TaxID=68211 RepID=A0ABP5ZIE0_9ACTN